MFILQGSVGFPGIKPPTSPTQTPSTPNPPTQPGVITPQPAATPSDIDIITNFANERGPSAQEILRRAQEEAKKRPQTGPQRPPQPTTPQPSTPNTPTDTEDPQQPVQSEEEMRELLKEKKEELETKKAELSKNEKELEENLGKGTITKEEYDLRKKEIQAIKKQLEKEGKQLRTHENSLNELSLTESSVAKGIPIAGLVLTRTKAISSVARMWNTLQAGGSLTPLISRARNIESFANVVSRAKWVTRAHNIAGIIPGARAATTVSITGMAKAGNFTKGLISARMPALAGAKIAGSVAKANGFIGSGRVASTIAPQVASKGLSVAGIALRGAGTVLGGVGAIFTAYDAATSIADAMEDPTAENITASAFNVGGTVIGGAIGFCMGGPVGAMVGMFVGQMAGKALNFLVGKPIASLGKKLCGIGQKLYNIFWK